MTLSPPARALFAGAILLVAGAPTLSRADVDPDCFDQESGFTCHKGRVEDAKLADDVIAPVLAKAGWDRGCYGLQYIKGDEGRADVLLVIVHGPRGSKPPICNQITNPGLSRAEAQRIYDRGGGEREMMKAISKKSIAQGTREAATSAQLREIGREIKKAILASESDTRRRVLRNSRQLGLGSGYGAKAEIPLP